MEVPLLLSLSSRREWQGKSSEDISPSPSILPVLDVLADLTLDYLNTLQSCSDATKLERLGDFLCHELCSPAKRAWISHWKIQHHAETARFKFVPTPGVALSTFKEVAAFLNLSTFAQNFADLIDYLEFERRIPFVHFSDWTCFPGKKKQVAYQFQPKGNELGIRTFYKMSVVGDFLEKQWVAEFRSHRALSVEDDEDNEDDNNGKEEEEECTKENDDKEDPKSNAAAPLVLTPPPPVVLPPPTPVILTPPPLRVNHVTQEWIHRLRWGDPVQVLSEEKYYHAIIVHVPPGEKSFCPIEHQTCFSVYYDAEDLFENGVLASRLRPEKETSLDVQSRMFLQRQYGQTSQGFGTTKKKNLAAGKRKRHQETPILSEESSASFLHSVNQRIGHVLPNQCEQLFHAIGEYAKGNRTLFEIKILVVQIFGEDDFDLALQFNRFLPQDLKISPKIVRKQARTEL